MDKIAALFNEYNNLWQEKLVHKQSIRKFHYYITYLTTMGSLALTFIGVSPTDLFKGESSKFLENPSEIATLLIIPLTPVILIILSFAINDIFHIYALGTQIGVIEKKINNIFLTNNLLTWEHKICPIIYGDKRNFVKGIKPMSSIIKLNDFWILIPFVLVICLASIVIGVIFIYQKFSFMNFFILRYFKIFNYYIECKWNLILCLLYISINIYFVIATLIIGRKLLKYIKSDGTLSININFLNRRF